MKLDSYADTGILVAIDLVNRLRIKPEAAMPALAEVLAVDPPSVARLSESDIPGFGELAAELYGVITDLGAGHDDNAAERLNLLLAAHPAHPHLAEEDGRWRLHHHPSTADLIGMWNSICAEALARVLSAGDGHRMGVCADAECGQVFADSSRNGSRRFCSTTCQNRVKTAALRQRRRHADASTAQPE